MDMNEDRIEPSELAAGLGAIRSAAAAIEPPPELEARLRRQLFGMGQSSVAAARASVAVAAPAPMHAAPARIHAAPAPIRNVRSSARSAIASRNSPSAGTFAERWAAWLVWPVSVAATIMLCSWMLVGQPALDPAIDAVKSPAEMLAQPSIESDGGTPFLALAPLDEISAAGRSEVVTATVPRATLAGFGLPVSPMHAADDISAEFLVAPSGGVLAVRFVAQ
jgi:hypothetical protein